MATPSVGTTNSMTRTQVHFISPVNLGFLKLSLISNIWIFYFMPTFRLFWLLFIGPTERFLRSKTPSGQVSSNCPNRKLYSRTFFYQQGNSLSCPKIKRKSQLFWSLVLDGSDNLSGLSRKKGSAFGSPLLFRFKRFNTVFMIFINPLTQCLASYFIYFGNLNLRFSSDDSFHGFNPYCFLSTWRKKTGIFCFHVSSAS